MLIRILEPEVMDTVAEAVDYNSMDHSTVNRLFVDDFLAAIGSIPSPESLQIFDAGTGTALIPLELVSRKVPVMITASDLAEQMLIVAAENVNAAGCDKSIRLVRSDCKQLPDTSATYDAVISNSIIHHIPEPRRVLAELWRILKPGGLLFVRDLMRPTDLKTLEWLVETYAGPANPHQKQMFRDSLHAALTVFEVGDMMRALGIPDDSVQATSDRHWTMSVRKSALIG
ncbi:MAG: class I SAM-dependent methyltransferase [Planctomycetota bacterium]